MESIGALIYDIGKALHDLHYLATSTQYKHPGISRRTLKMAKNCYITYSLMQGPHLVTFYRVWVLHKQAYSFLPKPRIALGLLCKIPIRGGQR